MFSLINRVRGYSGDIHLYLIYTLLANVAIGVFSLVFNLYLLQLGQREDYIGLFNAIQTMAMAGAAMSLGAFINRFGLWNTVFWGTIAYLGASVLLATVTEPTILLFLSALWGATSTFVLSTVMPFVAQLTRPRQRQEVAAVTMSLISLSTTIGSLVGGWAPFAFEFGFGFERPSAAAFRATMMLGIALAAIGVPPMLRMARDRLGPLRNQHLADSLASSDDGATPSTFRQRMLVFVGVGAIMSLGAGAVFPFYNVFLADIGATSGQIGIVFAVAWTIAAIVGLASPYVASKLGSQAGSALIRLVPVPFFLILMVFPSLSIAIFAHLVRVSAISMSWPIESSYISEVLPETKRNSVFGYRSAAWNVGFSLSSLAGGALIVRYGYNVTFSLYAAAMVVSMSLYYFYFRNVATAPYIDEEEPEVVEALAPEPGPVTTVLESDTEAPLTLEPGRGRPIVILSEDAVEESQPTGQHSSRTNNGDR